MKILDWRERVSRLDECLDNLKNEEREWRKKEIVDNFYDLKFELKDLSNDELLYVHVKLHHCWSFRCSVIPRSTIKRLHDEVVGLLKKHCYVDSLDD